MITNSKLFKKLQKLEKKEFGKKINPISSNISEHLIEVAKHLLATIPAYMPEYTLHNIKHCDAILNNIANILPEDVKLNIVELTILIQAVILHDIGMVINREDAKEIQETDDFKKLLIEFDKEDNLDDILTEYIRRTHVKRSLEYIDKFKNDYETYQIKFKYKGIDISDWVKNVIESHAFPVSHLKDTEKYPTDKLIGNHKVSIQYLSILLRLGDILDFDIYRTPPFLYKHIQVHNPISQLEWEKHLSIEGTNYSDKTIQIEAMCKAHEVESVVRDFGKWIEKERKESLEILSSEGYHLNLKEEVNLKCRNDGSYIFNELRVELSYDKILRILMGTELYEKEEIFIRELIQNAYDACNYAKEFYLKKSLTHEPKVIIRYNTEESTLEVEDNGSGINEEIFRNYVIKIGQSYYQSKKFELENLDFKPISFFGIGILSCYMVSDSIEIESLRISNNHSETPIHYWLSLNKKYVVQRNSQKKNNGTIIRLKLRKEFNEKLKLKGIRNIVEENMNIYKYPIDIVEDEVSSRLDRKSIEIPDEYHHFPNSGIVKIEDIKGLEGVVIFHRSQLVGLIKSSRISQNGFVVIKSSFHKLKPEWIKFITLYINISEPFHLQLKANRSNFIQNQEFYNLKEKLFNFIVEKFDKINREANIGIDVGNVNVISGHLGEYNFLINLPMFTAYIPSTKQSIEISFSSFQSLMKKRRIALVRKALSRKIKFNNPIFSNYDFIILCNHEINYLYQFSQPYIKETKLIISHIAGVTFYEISYINSIEYNVKDYVEGYKWRKKHSISDTNGNDALVFCAVGNHNYNNIDIQLNIKHSLGELMQKYEDESFIKIFKNRLLSNLAIVIMRQQKLAKFWNIQESTHFYEIEREHAYSLNSVNILTENFLEELNQYIDKEVLDKFVEMGVIEAQDKKQYLLSKSSFPSWFFEKQSKNKRYKRDSRKKRRPKS